jgi:hypothetical protein
MKPCTSQELLQQAGLDKPKNPEMPLEIRPLVITSVLNCVSAKTLWKALNLGDEVTLKHVLEWQKLIREWLGIQPIGRGKPSAEYKEAVAKWLIVNGNPTTKQIDQGWLPAHVRSGRQRWLAAYSQEIREQVARLKAARNDEERRDLLRKFLGEMGRSIPEGYPETGSSH